MKTISELFREQVARTPADTAIIFNSERVTYTSLNERANRIARYLRSKGIGREGRVAICLRHSPELVVTLLGVAKVGAAYVGLDPAWPASRMVGVLDDSGAAVLVIGDDERGLAGRFGGAVLALPSQAPEVSTESTDDLERATTMDDLFNIVYTSGSIGRPKGVLVTLRSVLNRLEWMWQTYPFQSGDVAFLYRPYTIVGFSWDCFGPLLQGVPTVITPVADTRNAIAIMQAAIESGTTHFSASVGFWEAVLEQAEHRAQCWPTLRMARTSGEPLRPSVVERWRRAFPHAKLLNIYGATECSGSTAYDTAMFDLADGHRVPVGAPVPGVEVLVVDQDMRVLGIGEEGEICIGGASLARGYLGDPALTAERFVQHPVSNAARERLFRTGDVGLWRSAGQLEVTGRRDLQVKVRGFRVELEEVEAALCNCAGVRAAAVHSLQQEGTARLVAFIVPDTGPSSASGLRAAMAEMLPSYMVPAEFVAVTELPMTSTGKIDRGALADLTGRVLDAATAYSAPRSSSEAAIASIWEEVLGMRNLGTDDDFFDVGGHSLSAIQIVSRLQDKFGVEVPIRALFDNPSIGGLAAEIDRTLGSVGARKAV